MCHDTASPAEQPPDALTQALINLALRAEWLPMASFADQCWRTLRDGAGWPSEGVAAIWQPVRKRTLTALERIGLTATVITTESHLSLAEHDCRVAGLVVLHRSGSRELPVPRSNPNGDHERAYQRRMFDEHELTPHSGLPADLRGFCGQLAEYSRPAWLDHCRTWVDQWGDPVLTGEPYAEAWDPARLVFGVTGLPLSVERHKGVWNSGTDLLIFRHDPNAEPLPSVHEKWAVAA